MVMHSWCSSSFQVYLENTLIEPEFEKYFASQLEVREATIIFHKLFDIKDTNDYS